MTAFLSVVPSFLTALILGLLTHAALHDISARTIPNEDSLALALLGLVLRAWHRQLVVSGVIALAALLLCHLLWSRRWLGGGDVKLLAACCCVVAPARVPGLIGGILCAGGVLAVGYLLAGYVLRQRGAVTRSRVRDRLWRRVVRREAWRMRRGAGIPYGVAISGMTLVTLVVA